MDFENFCNLIKYIMCETLMSSFEFFHLKENILYHFYFYRDEVTFDHWITSINGSERIRLKDCELHLTNDEFGEILQNLIKNVNNCSIKKARNI